MELSKQKCRPCEAGSPPMSEKEVFKHVGELEGWSSDGSKLNKKFKFKDFKETMAFVNKVADLAEEEGHHPDMAVSYGKLEILLWTHSVNGLSLNDFILASKIDKLS